MARVPFGSLPRESGDVLRLAARVEVADVVRFARGMKGGGKVAQGRVSLSQARAMITCGTRASPLQWSKAQLAPFGGGRAASALQMRAANAAVVQSGNFRMMDAALRLQQGEISGAQWYREAQLAVREMHAASEALARGGPENLTPRVLDRLQEKVFEQFNGREGKFPGLRAFAEDAAGGRYGAEMEAKSFLRRAAQYPEAARAGYENARLAVHSENGYEEAKRVLAAVSHCDGCVEAAGEWMPIDEILEIADCECGVSCHCVMVFRKSA